jgi:nucleoside recognition membrane protein YjiH
MGVAEASNKMVLECLDGTFCCVASMDTQWHELEVFTFIMHELFKQPGCFIVQSVESWMQASGNKGCMHTHVCSQNLVLCS